MLRTLEAFVSVLPVLCEDDRGKHCLSLKFMASEPRGLDDVFRFRLRCSSAQLSAEQATDEPKLAETLIGLDQFLDVCKAASLDYEA